MNKLLAKQKVIYLILGVILLAHVLILTRLIYFPYPELFVYPYLTNHGLKPYSQILDQHFPGLMFLPVNLDNLGMNTPEVARAWSITIVIIIQIMLFIVSSAILKSRTKALLVNILYLIWQPFFEGWVLWIDSFLPLFLLPAFYALYQGDQDDRGDGGDKWFFCAGLFLGLGIIFKQVLIPLAGLTTIYILWKKRNLRVVLIFLLGLFFPITLILVYLVSIGVLKDFWFWAIIFNLTAFAKSGRGTGPTTAHLIRALFVFGSAFFLLVLDRFKTKEAQLLAIFLTGTLLSLATRFDFVHFQPALPFAVLAAVYGLGRLGRLERLGVRIGYGLIAIWWLITFYKGHLGNRVISFDVTTYNLAAKIRDYTSPGEKIFVFGAAPHLYQMSGTLPAGDIFVFQFPWFLQFSQSRILDGIKKDNPKIIVSDRSVKIDEGVKITDFAEKIDQYIQSNYQKIDSVGTAEILQRK